MAVSGGEEVAVVGARERTGPQKRRRWRTTATMTAATTHFLALLLFAAALTTPAAARTAVPAAAEARDGASSSSGRALGEVEDDNAVASSSSELVAPHLLPRLSDYTGAFSPRSQMPTTPTARTITDEEEENEEEGDDEYEEEERRQARSRAPSRTARGEVAGQGGDEEKKRKGGVFALGRDDDEEEDGEGGESVGNKRGGGRGGGGGGRGAGGGGGQKRGQKKGGGAGGQKKRKNNGNSNNGGIGRKKKRRGGGGQKKSTNDGGGGDGAAEKVCSCDANYYSDDCSVFCESSETCSTNGFCSSDGVCECKEGKVGPTCACDAKECTSSSVQLRNSLCSSKGTCSNGECMCEPGYYGCNCEVFCAQSTTCSGHGTCTINGLCKCDPGYIGEDCSELDIPQYCRVDDDGNVFTISGYPCLLGLDGTVGQGFDIIQGTKTTRILQLRYTKGRTFQHNLLGTFEIPDNVDCEEITVDKLVSSTRTFTGTLEYRRELAAEFGVIGVFKSAFFSASAEFSIMREFRFRQRQFLVEKKQYHRLYSCKIRTSEPFFTTRASQIVADKTGEQRVRSLGTHVIDHAEFGGFIKVQAYLSSCLLATLDETEVSTEVGYAFAGVAVSGEYSSKCDLINSHSQFEKEVGGGDKSKLIVADIADPNYLGAWIDSLHAAPTVTRSNVYNLGVLEPAIQEDIGQYEVSHEVTDEIVLEEQPDVCPEVAAGRSTCADVVTSLGQSAGESNTVSLPMHLSLLEVASVLSTLCFFW